MSLLYTDGFDAGDYLLRWQILAGAFIGPVDGRFGGKALNIFKDSTIGAHSITPSAKIVVGCAVYHTYIGTSSQNSEFIGLYGDSGATQHINLRVMPDGSLGLYRGGTQLAVSAGGMIQINWWHYLEISTTIADAGGVTKVRLNGVEVISYTGDTKNGGTNTTVDQVRLRGLWNANTGSYVDDLYMCNGLGTVNNDFLGDVRVQTLVPTGPGTTTQLTPSTGANWSCVDELPYSTSDYVSGATAGLKDTYATADIAAGYTVKGIQLNAVGKKTDAGSRSLKTVVRSAGADYSGVGQALTASDNVVSRILESDPATSAAWTATGINAMEIGAEVA